MLYQARSAASEAAKKAMGGVFFTKKTGGKKQAVGETCEFMLFFYKLFVVHVCSFPSFEYQVGKKSPQTGYLLKQPSLQTITRFGIEIYFFPSKLAPRQTKTSPPMSWKSKGPTPPKPGNKALQGDDGGVP